MSNITKEDRELYWETVGVNLTNADGSMIPYEEWTERGLYALRKTQPDLYEKMVQKFIWQGFHSFTKKAIKDHEVSTVTRKDGKSRTVSRYVSVPVWDATQEKMVDRQKLVETLTVDELGVVKRDTKKQIDALGYNVEMCDRLIAFCVHQGVDNVPDALVAAGVTVDDVLGEGL